VLHSERVEIAENPDSLPSVRTPEPVKALCFGGSTGKPKLIESPGAFRYPAGNHPFGPLPRFEKTDLKFSPGPLYHNGPFFSSQIALFQGRRILINERSRAPHALQLINTFRPTILNLVPTMMQRMLREPAV
jgi:bile acid-coenzyme A ligase